MTLDRKVVGELRREFQALKYLRIINVAHKATPLGMGFGKSRFSSPVENFKLLYLAKDLATAIAETIVRDRFEGTAERVLDQSEFESWAVTEVSAIEPLDVIDLRNGGLFKLGVSTDAAGAKSHRAGQALSEVIHASFDTDGLLYSSRLTAVDCVAVYEHATKAKLKASAATELLRVPELVSSLEQLNVAVR